MSVTGASFAAVAAVCIGSCGAALGIGSCTDHKTVLLRNLWAGIGVGAASLPTWIVGGQVFNYRSLIGGAALGASTCAYFSAIEDLGLTVASALTCGTGILASNIFRIKFQHQPLQRRSIGAAAVLMIVLSLAGTAMTGRYNMFLHSEAARAAEGRLDSDEEDEILEALHERELAEETVLDPLHEARNVRRVPQFLVGLTSSIAAGVIGGFAAASNPLSDQATLALGFMAASIIILTATVWYSKTCSDLADLKAIPFGMASGILLFIGNGTRSISAERSGPPEIRDGILSATFLIAGLWGIVYNKELTRGTIPAYLVSGIGLAAGAIMLAVASRPASLH